MSSYRPPFPPTRHRPLRGGRRGSILKLAAVAAVIVAVAAIGVTKLVQMPKTRQAPATAGLKPGASGRAGSRAPGSASPGHSASPPAASKSGSASGAPAQSPAGASGPAGPSGSPGRGGKGPARPALIPTSSLLSTGGALLGAYVPPTGGTNAAAYERAITSVNGKIGRKIGIDQMYMNWDDDTPTQLAQWDQSQGILPMITWRGTWAGLIAKGQFDSRFQEVAAELKQLGKPVLLRWFPEMDTGVGYSLTVSVRKYIAAWQHVWQIFHQAGATKVAWVWCPSASGFASGTAQTYYPGAAYVDWVCSDGYNWAPHQKRAPWQSLDAIFSAFYKWGLTTGKPLMIGEFGVLERSPGDKAAWLRQAGSLLAARFPAIRAAVYYDADYNGYEWRFTTSADALAAFQALAGEQYFGTRPRL